MSRFVTPAQHNAILQAFVGDMYAAIYDVPYGWSARAHFTDMDMEPYRVSRIVTLDMQIEKGSVLSTNTVVLARERDTLASRSFLIVFNDVGEHMFCSPVRQGHSIWARPGITVSDF